MKVNDDEFASVAAFAQASAHEDHGVGADPRFVNPVEGDLHLLAGPPAIDSAHSGVSGFQLFDLEGMQPKDDLAVPNTGAGSPSYADRGALEFDPPDSSAPDTTITAGPGEGSATNSNSPSFEFNSTESPSTFECRLDDGVWENCSSPESVGDLGGEHTFSVRATDQAGNVDPTPATRTWTVDTILPNTIITSGPENGSTSGSASATFEFASTKPASTFECRLDTGDWGACTTPQGYSDLSDGEHTFSVRAADAVGNTDPTPRSRTWRVDTVSPDTTITVGPEDGSSTNLTNAAFEFTSTKTPSTFECRLDDANWETCSSTKTYSDLSNGSHTFSVVATDQVGNTDPTPATRTFTVDDDPPATTITRAPKKKVKSKMARFAFTSSEPDSIFQCKRNGRRWRKCTSPRTYLKFKKGRHFFRVRAIDAVGNVDPTPAKYNWRIVKRQWQNSKKPKSS